MKAEWIFNLDVANLKGVKYPQYAMIMNFNVATANYAGKYMMKIFLMCSLVMIPEQIRVVPIALILPPGNFTHN